MSDIEAEDLYPREDIAGGFGYDPNDPNTLPGVVSPKRRYRRQFGSGNDEGIPALPHKGKNGYQVFHVSPKVRRIVALHVNGIPIPEIGMRVNLGINRIYQILGSARVKQILGRIYSGQEAELSSLVGGATSVLRRGLSSSDTKVALRAADMVLKANNKYKDAEQKRETAEDVIARVLQAVKTEKPDGSTRTEVRVIEHRGPSIEHKEGGDL